MFFEFLSNSKLILSKITLAAFSQFMILPDVIIRLTIQNIPQLEFKLETLKNVFFISVRFTKNL
jgi:hypothetical protein